MTLKQYLVFMSLATIVAWLVFGLVLFFIDPDSAALPVYAIFYISLFVALLGSMTLGGFFVRNKFLRQDEVVARQVGASLRQGFFFSFLITGSIYLQSKNLLVWWNVLLLILALTILEFFFISYRRH